MIPTSHELFATTPADVLIHKRLDTWAEHLLDTSRRNRLLYFNPRDFDGSFHEPDYRRSGILVVKGKAELFRFADDSLFDDDWKVMMRQRDRSRTKNR